MIKSLKFIIYIFIAVSLIIGGKFLILNMYPLNYFDIVKENCDKYDIDPLLVMSIIRAESGFNENAVSTKKAKGLMQLTDETAIWCSEEMKLNNFKTEFLFNPETNIIMGTHYCDYLLEHFGNTKVALAAYNAGMGNVQKWLKSDKYTKDGITLDEIPFPETKKYVNKIMNNYKIYKLLYGGKR